MKHILLFALALSLCTVQAQTPNTFRDPSFTYDPTAAGTLTFNFQEYSLNRVYALSDGKVMVVGSFGDSFVFNTVSGIMRLNSDGSFDETFDAPDQDEEVTIRGKAFVELPNGQCLLGGRFQNGPFGGFLTGLMRLNNDGSQDMSFGEGISYPNVEAIAVQPDGKILIGGIGASLIWGSGVARLNADGTLDESFSTEMSEFRDVRDLTLLPDGRILVAGNFNSWPSPTGNHFTGGLALLNSDGSLNTSFSHPAATAVSVVVSAYPRVAVQPDGKVVVASLSSNDDLVAVRRYNSDLTVDQSFYVANNLEESGNYFTDVTVLADGKILLTGYFITSYDGDESVSGILRLNPDGTLDPTFNTNNGFGNGPQVFHSAVQSDGKILLFTINSTYQEENISFTNPDFAVSQLVIRLNGDVGPALSAGQAESLEFEMFPNPASDFVTLRGVPFGATVRIFDVQGRQVFQSVNQGENQTIDTKAFQPGMYILSLADGVRRSSQKLLITH
jgi:uncharacterized delta-60 repeat protein